MYMSVLMLQKRFVSEFVLWEENFNRKPNTIWTGDRTHDNPTSPQSTKILQNIKM